jgi:2-hydroxy-6-oxonona-2,4-dienedioate hydrolase
VHELIPGSTMVDPPWPDSEWNERSTFAAKNGGSGHFAGWPLIAPPILDFIGR